MEPANSPYTELGENSLQSFHFFKISLNIIFQYKPVSSEWSYSFKFFAKIGLQSLELQEIRQHGVIF